MKLILISVSLLFSNLGSAESFSASHFGFALENNSLYELKQVGGSMILLDWGKSVGKRFSWGLKTVANGAHQDNVSLFRLTSGPAVHYRWPDLELHYSMGFYQESVSHNGVEQSEASANGYSQSISLQRYHQLRPQVEIGWGSYMAVSYGRIDRVESRSQTHLQQLRWSSKKSYRSHNQGIYCSLRVTL